jgi:hypothetical protein
MLAALGMLFGFTGSNEPKPLVDMSDWKPHDPSTAVAYCVWLNDNKPRSIAVDRYGHWKVALEPEQPHFLAPLAREEVDAVDEAHPVAARAHEQRLRARAVGEETDAAQ